MKNRETTIGIVYPMGSVFMPKSPKAEEMKQKNITSAEKKKKYEKYN